MKVWKVRKDVALNRLAEFGYEFGEHGIIGRRKWNFSRPKEGDFDERHK